MEQVWPVETPAPPSIKNATLRPYQKQSLAFMLHRETLEDETLCGRLVCKQYNSNVGLSDQDDPERNVVQITETRINYHNCGAAYLRNVDKRCMYITKGGFLCDEMVRCDAD